MNRNNDKVLVMKQNYSYVKLLYGTLRRLGCASFVNLVGARVMAASCVLNST